MGHATSILRPCPHPLIARPATDLAGVVVAVLLFITCCVVAYRYRKKNKFMEAAVIELRDIKALGAGVQGALRGVGSMEPDHLGPGLHKRSHLLDERLKESNKMLLKLVITNWHALMKARVARAVLAEAMGHGAARVARAQLEPLVEPPVEQLVSNL